MSRKFLFALFCSALTFNLACSSTTAPNSNANANSAAAANQKLPEGLSASPLPMTGTTPGIPDPKSVNMNSLPKGATPTPGIPDPKELGKPLKPGATPTPGIPDPKTLQKQSNQSQSDSVKPTSPNPPANKPPTQPSEE
jgi:hypothetical protein